MGAAHLPDGAGHEIVGVVTRAAARYEVQAGDKSAVGLLRRFLPRLRSCRDHLEQYCLNGVSYTYNSHEQDHETPTWAVIPTRSVVDENYVLCIPGNLPLDAAARSCARASRLYSPLRHWQAGGKKVAIVLAGVVIWRQDRPSDGRGGHGSQPLAGRNRPTASASAPTFYATADPHTFVKLAASFDLIVCTVGTGSTGTSISACSRWTPPMVVVGLPRNACRSPQAVLIGMRPHPRRSQIGGIKETQEMLDFCGKHNIASDIELIPIQKVNEALRPPSSTATCATAS